MVFTISTVRGDLACTAVRDLSLQITNPEERERAIPG